MPDYRVLKDGDFVSSVQDLYSCCPDRAEMIITESIQHGYFPVLQTETELFKREKELFHRTCKKSEFSNCSGK